MLRGPVASLVVRELRDNEIDVGLYCSAELFTAKAAPPREGTVD